MHVLIIHNAYVQRGGEDAVVEREANLLKSRGHVVTEYLRHNRTITRSKKAGVAMSAFWSQQTISDVQSLIAGNDPDIIHVHNTLPLVSPSVYWAAASKRIPVVQTLHNFRLICPAGTLLRDGHICEECVGHIPWRAVKYGCYRSSRTESAVVAGLITVHRSLLHTYADKVTRYIALNEFARDKFIEAGFAADRIDVKPNVVDIARVESGERRGGLFVGRLSQEKGLAVLAGALAELPGVRINVIGEGPEARVLDGSSGVTRLGWQSPAEVQARMRAASYLVVPSIWYEPFGLVALEAFACGLPAIASRIGALANLVADGRTGLLVEPNNPQDLKRAIAWAEAHPEEMRAMGEHARREYETRYSVDANYGQLMAIYERAILDVQDKRVHA